MRRRCVLPVARLLCWTALAAIAAPRSGYALQHSRGSISSSTELPDTTTLSALVEDLPDALPAPENQQANRRFMMALAAASPQARVAALPALMRWVDDTRDEVRGFALGLIGTICTGSTRPGSDTRPTLPAEDIPQIAAHLLDPSGGVRNKAALALTSAGTTERGSAEMLRLLPPLLLQPDVLRQFADPFFARSLAYMLDHAATLSQRDAILRMQQQKPPMLPAVGPLIMGLLLNQRGSSDPGAAQTMLAFLQRGDQNAATLSESLHLVALSADAPEAVQNAAVTRVFDQGAMSVFLMQFLNNLQLTPEHLQEQRARLVRLSTDPDATAQVRHAAASVAACWVGDRSHLCKPDAADFQQGGQAAGSRR